MAKPWPPICFSARHKPGARKNSSGPATRRGALPWMMSVAVDRCSTFKRASTRGRAFRDGSQIFLDAYFFFRAPPSKVETIAFM